MKEGLEMKSVYDFQGYREFIQHQIKESSLRGIQGKLAEAANCHPSYLTTTLKGQTELTPEHAVGMAQFWNLNTSETEYFLELVNYGRAGSPALRNLLKGKLENLREKASALSNQVSLSLLKGSDAQAVYYSDWLFPLLHVSVGIPALSNAKALAIRFGVSVEIIEMKLAQLEQMGLVEKHQEKWVRGKGQMHLPANSPYAPWHHQQWRTLAALDGFKLEKKSLHYSAVHTLQKSDAENLRRRFTQVLTEATQVVRTSKEEAVYCLNLDWFEP